MKIAVETIFNKDDERVKKLTDLRNPFNMSEIDTMLAVITQIQHKLVRMKDAWESGKIFKPESEVKKE